MTLLGKIFTLMIFVMTLVFMTVSVMVYATHRNWRELVMNPESGLRKQLSDLEEQNIALRNEIVERENELAHERAARRHAIAALETRYQQVLAERDAMDTQLAQLVAAHGVATDTLRVTQDELTRLTTEVTDNRGLLTQVLNDRDEKLARAVALADQINQLEGTSRRLEERRLQLVDQIAKQKAHLDAAGIRVTDPLPGTRIPSLDGTVIALGESNLIEVSIGGDDGIREGVYLEVTRGASYLGRIQVVKVAPDRAVAKVLPEFLRGQIKKGDKVVTKVS